MRKRTKFLALRTSVILAFAILGGRLWYVQVVMGSYYKAQGDTSKIRNIPIQANRGIVYDRNGRQLVWNAPSWNIEVVPHGVPSSGTKHLYALLSGLMHGTPSATKIARLVGAGNARPYQPVIVKGNVSTQVAMVVLQYHSRLPGVRVQSTSQRHYREDGLRYSISHILGYAGTVDPGTYATYRRLYPREHVTINDLVGKDGVELQYDPYLHGINGNEQVEVDAGERPVRTVHSGGSVAGDSIYLTLDWGLQKQVSADLKAALAKYNLRQGVAVVEDVRTGEILSMVSLPSYNNNWFSDGISYNRYQSLRNDPAFPLTNLATAGLFPPGSTFKVITAAAALGTGVVTPSTTYDDTGVIRLPGGQAYLGWKTGGLGPVDLEQAIQQSSDIYFYTVAGGNPNLHPDPPHIGANRLAQYARLYGLGQNTGIDLPNEQKGFVPSATWFNNLPPTPYLKNKGNTWTIGYTYNMAIGQGQVLATPLQVANYTAMLANGGTLFRPRIAERITGRIVPGKKPLAKDQTIQAFAPSIIRRNFLPASTIALIRHGMLLGTQTGSTGTSYAAYDPRFQAAGKTGTAEVFGQAPHAWWTGFAPYDNPQIAVTVLVPHANAEGAEYAAPIAHKIFEDYFGDSPYRNPYNLYAETPGHDGSNGQWLQDVQKALVGGGGSQ